MRALSLVMIGLVGCSTDSDGPPGPEGPLGERGSDGSPGPQGERGSLGPPGDRGTRGDEGIRGETGERGERGEQGVPGPPGTIGPQGPAGPSGADGTSCFGESIPDGMQITCGEETFVLRHGEDGSPGPPGARGVQGPPGPPGEMGPQGEQGPVGSEGTPGQDGVSCTAQDVLEGIQISCGNVSVLIRHGDQGMQGERGAQGPPGPQGPEGPAGRDGQDFVARCPEGSLGLEFNSHLRYCVRKLIFEEPRTISRCQVACLEEGLTLADKADLLTICIGAPDFFDEDVLVHGEGGQDSNCNDGIDNDNDGSRDCDDAECQAGSTLCGRQPGATFTLSYFTPGELNGHLTRYDILCADIQRDLAGVRREHINYGIYVSPINIPNYPKGCLCGKWL